MKITKIEIQKKNKKRYNLYIDDEFKMGIHEDVIVYLGLYVNQIIDESMYDDILLKEVKAQAKADAMNFISYRMRSRYEVKEKLRNLDYTEELIEETLLFLMEYGYLNDLEFTKSFIHDKATVSKHSLKKIRYDLKAKGISQSTFDDALQYYTDQDIDFEYDNAKILSKKKYDQLKAKNKYNEYELKQRVYQYMVQKGYLMYLVKDALNDALEEAID